MVMRLFDTQRSGNAWKVRLLASFLGLPLARKTLSIDRGDLASPEFAKLNMFRQVPVLDLGNSRTLSESMAILFYLADGTAWWPRDRMLQSDVMTWLSFEQSRHMPPLAKLRLHLALHPDWPREHQQIREWHEEAVSALQCLETGLTRMGPAGWVATSEHPSIADVALYPYTRLARMGGVNLGDFAATSSWLDRFESLPGYEPLFPGRPELTESTKEMMT